jgi:flagellar basal-body rod modification protein FlgD
MATTATSSSAATAGQILNGLLNTSTANTTSVGDGTEDRFLKLLVTQMQNQDPLNPMDNAQVTSQIAQINTVNGIDKLNAAFSTFSSNMLAAQTLQATGLIGHGVLASGNSVTLAGGHAVGGAQLSAPADDVVVSITTLAGQSVQTLHLGAQDAGTVPFDWDGTRAIGGISPDGKYAFKVSAVRGQQSVDVTPLSLGVVGSVGINNGNVTLEAGTLGNIAIADVKRIL